MFKIIAISLLFQTISAITTVRQENENYFTNYINREEESARKFLQRYNSFNPVILLVENSQASQNAALNFLKSVHKLEPRVQNVNFMLMKFNETSVSPVLGNNKLHLEKLLIEKIPPKPSTFLGRETNRSAVFFGILNAVHVLPPSSGVVVFMKRDVEDEDLSQHAAIEVEKKRIQVFVFCGAKRKGGYLEELAVRSRGGFWIQPDRDLSSEYYEEFLENINAFTSVVMILSRRNLRGENNLVFPIDSDVTGVHISIAPEVTTGLLTTPGGYNIGVLRGDDVVRYSAGSFIKRGYGVHEIHINTTTPDVGVWRLRVSNARALYNVTVFAHTTKITDFGTAVNKTGNKKKILKVGLTSAISNITHISFVNRDGNPILSNVSYLSDNKEIQVPNESFYAVIDGIDSKGDNFRRLSYVRGNEKDIFFLPPITIDLGLGSELITQPYRQPQLFFEVTNNGNTPTLVRFFCKDDKGILLSMDPWYKWINPQETATVRVTLTTRSGQYQDFITFTAAGTETVTKKVIVDVGISSDDRRDPHIDYHFTSDCTGVLLGSCEDATWTVEVKAKDTGSGLLQVISRPKGIYFPNGFTSGTTEEVTGFFSESCCNPDLELIAFDRQNNRRTRHINAYWATLSPGAIAAIVLGVIILILLIIGLFFLIRRCCIAWRNKESYDLPVYRGPLSSRRA
ncbi:uncharacterized protein LOC123006088 isoform X2 [Tribolium madens]|uniref:uncharacterized protein LOC123006088 isoform X2 n=1 Tax=Tribolium madens TaxID=41895 RepID=UPI001CF73868|nr:uncharacterized protein LOC123006088 isoform X2 [Tribolium madens]